MEVLLNAGSGLRPKDLEVGDPADLWRGTVEVEDPAAELEEATCAPPL